ncbi:MAG: NAD(P)H-hydrate epimerase, partial [Dehalococcoidia bacterium]
MKLVTSEEMRALESAAIAAGSSAGQLMEEAGLAVAQEAWLMLGSLEGRRIAVLVGPGNNGGDGLVAARHLAEWGAEVQAIIPEERRDMSLAADFGERGIEVAGPAAADAETLARFLGGADLVIDALLGIGKRRPLVEGEPIGAALVALGAARQGPSPPRLIAVDLPTGVDADSGAADPLTVAPDMTVTFGLPKVGMYQAPASALVG